MRFKRITGKLRRLNPDLNIISGTDDNRPPLKRRRKYLASRDQLLEFTKKKFVCRDGHRCQRIGMYFKRDIKGSERVLNISCACLVSKNVNEG